MMVQARDDYNWPMLNRKDLMSNTGLSKDTDGCEIKTVNSRLKTRIASTNLYTRDIDGKQGVSSDFERCCSQGLDQV